MSSCERLRSWISPANSERCATPTRRLPAAVRGGRGGVRYRHRQTGHPLDGPGSQAADFPPSGRTVRPRHERVRQVKQTLGISGGGPFGGRDGEDKGGKLRWRSHTGSIEKHQNVPNLRARLSLPQDEGNLHLRELRSLHGHSSSSGSKSDVPLNWNFPSNPGSKKPEAGQA